MKKNIVLLVGLVVVLTINAAAQVDLNKALLLHLKMDGNIADSSKNNYSVINTSAKLTKDRFSADSMAYKFDGIKDFLTVKSIGNDLPKDSITICLWVNAVETKGGNTFMLMPDNTSNRVAGSFFFAHNGKSAHFVDFGGISKRIFYEPDNQIQTWTFMLMTRSAAELKLFKNGAPLQTVTNPSSYTQGNTDLRIGGGADGNFNGSIDDFRIYSRVLNASEIDALYNYGKAGISKLNANAINVYPNPLNNNFIIDYPLNEINSIRVVNSLGQNVDYTNEDGLYSLQTTISGFYWLEVNTKQGVFTKKMLLNFN